MSTPVFSSSTRPWRLGQHRLELGLVLISRPQGGPTSHGEEWSVVGVRSLKSAQKRDSRGSEAKCH